jgi:peptide/nickel transport system ATP-binding protein
VIDVGLLEVRDLAVCYKSLWGVYKVLDGVSLNVGKGEIVGIAGESGSGKSTLAEGVLRLIRPPGYIPKGKVIFEGVDLLMLGEQELQQIRWKKLAYIPQGSMNSLNPVLKIGDQMTDVMMDHGIKDKREMRDHIVERLRRVGLSESVLSRYPHELSGGMRQRVVIVMATLLDPTLIIADEPTTALDIVSQKQVITQIIDLNREMGTSVMLISHDLSIHAQASDRLVIMYAGKIVEFDRITKIFERPSHPYTSLLLESVPRLEKREIKGIPGLAPSPLNWPSGCRFHTRCPIADEYCANVEPELRMKSEDHEAGVACHKAG